MCNAGNCHLKRDGQNCDQTFDNELRKYSLTCSAGNCTVDLKCNGTHCRQMCNGGACIDLKYHGNGNECKQTCFRECNVVCHGISCEQRCSALKEQGSFQVHCPVVGRASKWQQNCENKESQSTKTFIAITEATTWTGEW